MTILLALNNTAPGMLDSIDRAKSLHRARTIPIGMSQVGPMAKGFQHELVAHPQGRAYS